jgi:tetratricopeptide (TPR) repeat protein
MIRRVTSIVLLVTLLALLPGCGRVRDGFYRLRGDAFRAANQPEKAITWYARIASNRQDIVVVRALTKAYAQRRDVTNLLAACARLAALSTNAADARLVVTTLLRGGYAEHAVPHIRQLIVRAPDDWQYKELLLLALQRSGASNGVPNALRQFAQTMPDTSTNALRLGLLWLEYDRVSNATAFLARSLALDPGQDDVRRVLAATLLETKQYAAALPPLLLMVSNNAANAESQRMLADAYNGLGHVAPAMTHYRRAIQSAPHDALALNNYAYLLLQHDTNLTEAYELALSAVQQDRKPYALDTLAVAYYKKGAYDAALRTLREAEQLAEDAGEPLDPEIEFHFGLVHAARGDCTYAVRRFRAALAQQPSLRAELARQPYFDTIESQLSPPHEHTESTP